MSRVTIIVVDDEKAMDLATQLQRDLNHFRLSAKVSWANSPGELFSNKACPDLILLDHHWPEVTAEKILERCQAEFPQSRIVMFTGKPIDPQVVLQCARFGVAEYMVKGGLQGDVLARRLHIIATSPDQSIERLAKPSGTVRQLFQEFEKATESLKFERAARERIEKERDTLRSTERRDLIFQVVRFSLYLLFMVIAVWLLWFFSIGGIPALGVLLLALVGMLLIDHSSREFLIRFSPGRLEVRKGGQDQVSGSEQKGLSKGAGG